MRSNFRCIYSGLIVLAICLAPGGLSGAERIRVASYNLENYLHEAVGTRPAKSSESSAKIRESFHAMKAQVVGLQEIGTTNALLELRESLAREGLAYPYWEHVGGFDTTIFVGVLSQFPIVARRPHTNEWYVLHGRRFQSSRGFAEVEIRVNPNYTFTLMTAHLKSRRPVGIEDETQMRMQEALLLRRKIDERLQANPRANLIVLGDFNDLKDSRPIRAIIGRGKTALIDTRPAERHGSPVFPSSRTVAWTHFFGQKDLYSRIDYILVSPGMAREWIAEETFIPVVPDWGLASDHRPVVAGFWAEDR